MWKKKKPDFEDRIRTIEHLKNFCGQIIDMYQEGTGPGATEPMSPAMAKLLINDEIHRQLMKEYPENQVPSYLRISSEDKINVLSELCNFSQEVVSIRWLGPRNEGDITVVYATLLCSSVERLAEIILVLEKAGLDVRDGTYGVFLK